MKKKTVHFHTSIIPRWRAALKNLPGWWFVDEGLIRVRRSGRKFIASVYELPDDPPFGRASIGPGRSVIGTYSTIDEARKSARHFFPSAESPKLTTWRDVEKARRQMIVVSDTVPEGAKA